MNLEGPVNTFTINSVRSYQTPIKSRNIVLYNISDKSSLNSELDKYMDRNTLVTLAYSNPEALNILKSKGLSVDPNIRTFKKNVYAHSVDTKNIAMGIYNNLPKEIKEKVSLKDISDAAILHDIGKAFIPEKILTKTKGLTAEEEDIMQIHSSLSSAILKKQGYNDNVLNIIKLHHQNPKHSGYPKIDSEEKINLETQIVSLADKYSALREKRSYKRSMSAQEALKLLYSEVDKGVSHDLYNALFDYAMSNNSTKNTKTLSNYLNLKNIIPQQTRRVS